MEKIKFSELKKLMLNDEISHLSELGPFKGLTKNYTHEELKEYKIIEKFHNKMVKECISELKADYRLIKNINHLINYLDSKGFRQSEAIDLIFSYIIK